MSDPVGGGIGKASQQMMQELQRNMQQAQEQNVGKPQFQELVAQGPQNVQGVQQTPGVQDVHKVQEATKTADVLRVAVNDPARLGVKPVEGAQKAENGGFKTIVDQVVDGQNKLDDIIKMSLSGKQFDQQQLLAIQAAVYKFSQELDLTSKVVEKATSGIKQTMQTQV